MLVFCGNCYLALNPLKFFIPYVILRKLRFQYFLSIACYNETKYINDCVSAIPIDDLSNICLNIIASSRDAKLYNMV